MARLLIIDDKPQFADPLAEEIAARHHQVDKAYTEKEAKEKLECEFDLVILDLALEERDRKRENFVEFEGYHILELIKKRYPLTMVIVMSGYPERNRLKALEKGAFDFIDKTDRMIEFPNEVLIRIDNALTFKQLNMEKVEREVENAIKEMSGLDDKGYLTVTTKMMIKQFKDVDDRFAGLSDRNKFRMLTERLSEKYIRKLSETCNSDVRDALHSLIMNSCEMDVLLYLTQKRYRDHYKHQFLVGSLGWFLLETLLPGGNTLREQIEQISHLSMDDIDQAWWTAALLHDHGYPLSYILKSVREINRLEEFAGGGGSFIKKLKNLYESYNNIFSKGLLDIIGERELDLIRKSFRICVNCFLPGKLLNICDSIQQKDLFDHGIVGAVNIVSFLNQNLSGNQSDVIRFIKENHWIKESLMAIAFHNSSLPELKLTLEEHPIAWLLKLCDELQEWDRKTFYRDYIEGDLLVETDHIMLGCLNYDTNRKKYAFGGKASLSVLFEYRDPEKLEKTGWNHSLFEESKRKHLSTLSLSNAFWGSLSFEVAKLNNIGI